MQQFRASADAVVWIDRPWKLNVGTGAKVGAAGTDDVRLYYRSPTGALTGYVTATFQGTAQTWVASLDQATLYESGVWSFYSLDMTNPDEAVIYGVFEWGGNYEAICAAAYLTISNADATYAAAANAETHSANAEVDAATAAAQSTAGAASAAIAATQATTAATQATTAATQATLAAHNVTTGRLFQYTASAVSPAPKSKLWLRNAADDGWQGYYPCYANTTAPTWPIPWADVVWPQSYGAVAGTGAFVADTAGPT